MAKVDAKNVAATVVRIAREDGAVTVRDLKAAGHSAYEVAKAVEAGILRVLKTVERTGKRGRPATLYTLTAKGKRAAAKQ